MALGVYVHLPFCPYICPYCDFAKWPHRKSVADRYFAALVAEVEAAATEPAATIFYGGGTPNAYDAEQIVELTERLKRRFPAATDRQEITIEVNPELVRAGDFRAYAGAGVDRVSIGVQSFVPAEIATLGRKHTAGDVSYAVSAAREAGIRSVSLDLMFAVPGQTPESWAESLKSALALDVDHVSTYGLTVEEGTPYAAWRRREPRAFASEDAEAVLYAAAIDTLEAAGFRHYEISNFARAGHESRHNAHYWRNGEYAGLGVGAASYRDGVRSMRTRSLDEYLAAVESGRPVPAERERLVGSARVGEAVMLALRTADGVDQATFKDRYGIDVFEYYARVIARYTEAGMLEIEGTAMRLTRRGRFLANDVCGAFVTFE